LPPPYENAKDAAIARAATRGPRDVRAASAESSSAYGVSLGTPAGRHVIEIIDSKAEKKTNDDKAFCFSYRIHGGKYDGEEFSHRFTHSDWVGTLDKDSRIADLQKATGRCDVNDSAQLHGAMLCAVVSKGGRIKYETTDKVD